MCCLLAFFAGWSLLWRRLTGAVLPREPSCRGRAGGLTRLRRWPAVAAAGLVTGIALASSLAAAEAMWPEVAALHAPICSTLSSVTGVALAATGTLP